MIKLNDIECQKHKHDAFWALASRNEKGEPFLYVVGEDCQICGRNFECFCKEGDKNAR